MQSTKVNIAGSDADADAFVTAHGNLTAGEETAIRDLVDDLKAQSLWTKFSAIYPIVGGTAADHKWNLKDPRDLDAAYRLTFGSGITHAATGIKGDNSTNGYAETYIIPSVAHSLNSMSMWYYSTEDITGTGDIDMGVNTNSTDDIILAMDYDGANGYSSLNNTQTNNYHLAGSTAAFMGSSRIASNQFKLYVNGTSVSTVSATSAAIEDTYSILLLAAKNTSGGVSAPSPRECAFAAIGDGLSDAEASALHTLVTTYQTALSRQN